MSTFKMSSITETEWPQWTIDKTSYSFVTLEDQHIQRLFFKIHTQLETLRSLSAEQGEQIQNNIEKLEQHEIVLSKMNKLEEELIQCKLDAHKYLKEIEVLKHKQHELGDKIAIQDEYIDKIHEELDQQKRNYHTLEIKFNESQLGLNSLPSLQPVVCNDNDDSHSLEMLENGDLQQPQPQVPHQQQQQQEQQQQKKVASDPTHLSMKSVVLRNMELQANSSPNISNTFQSKTTEMNVTNITTPLSPFSTSKPASVCDNIQQPLQQQQQQQQSHNQDQGLDQEQDHDHGRDQQQDPSATVVTESSLGGAEDQKYGSDLEDHGDDKTESISQYIPNPSNLQMNSSRSILNPTLHLPIHSSTNQTGGVSMSGNHRYDVLTNRLNTLVEETQNSQKLTQEELKIMKSKWNKKFHEMHDWIVNFINQNQHNLSGELPPLLPSMLTHSTSHAHSDDQQQQNQNQQQPFGTISIFQCPECYRLSKTTLSEEGILIPLQSTISHSSNNLESTMLLSRKSSRGGGGGGVSGGGGHENHDFKQKIIKKSISRPNVDLPVTINRSGECQKHRIDLKMSSNINNEIWWNMVQR